MFTRIIRHKIKYISIIFGLIIISSIVWHLYHNFQNISPTAHTFNHKSELGELENTSASQYSQYTDFVLSLQDALQTAFERPESSIASYNSIETLEYAYECCNPNITYPYRKSILYLKTHKCASSTLQNILMRFGLNYELNFMLPKDHDRQITYYQPEKYYTIAANCKTPDGKYDILTHHIIYTPDIKNVLPPGTASITMLRSIPSLFESIYNFYGVPRKTGKSLQDYLENPFDLNILGIRAAPNLNQMSMDLGFERRKLKNETAIAKFIEFVDTQFDLVMIVEHIEESLVLLAHLMGWPLDHVTYISSNTREKEDASIEYQLTESDKERIKQLNHVDTLLYDYFLKKFQKCRQQFGIERLQNEVRKLQALNQALKERCVAGEGIRKNNQKVNLKIYQPKNVTDWECIYTTMFSADFTAELKIRQSERLNFQKLSNKNLDHL